MKRKHSWTRHHSGRFTLCRNCGVSKDIATRLGWTCGPVDLRHPVHAVRAESVHRDRIRRRARALDRAVEIIVEEWGDVGEMLCEGIGEEPVVKFGEALYAPSRLENVTLNPWEILMFLTVLAQKYSDEILAKAERGES